MRAPVATWLKMLSLLRSDAPHCRGRTGASDGIGRPLGEPSRRAPRGGLPDVWDNACVIVDFANGARAMLDLCMFAEGSEYQEKVAALAALGKIEATVPGPLRF